MARRLNELFIGADKLTMNGRTIKHPALIKLYASVNVNKINDKPVQLVGMDLETDYKTAELKLLGFWDGKTYAHYRENFLSVIFSWVRQAYRTKVSIAYWNRLDPFVLFKQFLLTLSPQDATHALQRFGKISGEWDRKNGKWLVKPVIEIRVNDWYFGIKNAIRSSMQFFYYRQDDEQIKTVWAYDIAQLFENGLEWEALGELDKATNTYPKARLPYYSKGDEELHKIDWQRFDTDLEFQKRALKSNELDARAVYDLGNIVQKEFFTSFGHYPNTLVSQGSLARCAIVATLHDKYNKLYPDQPEIADDKLAEDVKHMGIIGHYDQWANDYGGDFLKDFYCLLTESYSGGYIESVRYGFASEGYYSDIASAYPAVIMKLYDLRGCKITTGIGTPPHVDLSYCFIRGEVDIPLGVNFHPVTVKHPINLDTNIRAVGNYRASYSIEERDFLLSVGATFQNEVWYNVETLGVLSPLAEIAQHFIELRTRLRKAGNSAQYMAKIAVNSMYGILFEAVDTFMETTIKHTDKENHATYDDQRIYNVLRSYMNGIDITGIKDDMRNQYDTTYYNKVKRWSAKSDGTPMDIVSQELSYYGITFENDHPVDQLIEMDNLYNQVSERINHNSTVSYDINDVVRAGYRAGEFFNPLYASIITSRTRILIAKCATEIERKGGKPILIMTDSIFWTGTAEMMPTECVREIKTVGYFEKPEHVTDIVCLGSGRYSYISKNGEMFAKKRGLNASDIHDPDGIIVGEYHTDDGKIKLNWHHALTIMAQTHSEKLTIGVRLLVSVGVILNNSHYALADLGLVVDEVRNVDVIVGKSKRFYDDGLKNPAMLATQMVDTRSIYLSDGMFGTSGLNDQTLPELRDEIMKKTVVTAKTKSLKTRVKATKKYNEKIAFKKNPEHKHNYDQLKDYGYTVPDARKMAKWCVDRINKKLMEDGKI